MNRLFLFLFLLSVIACKEVTFESPQPKGKKALSSIPKSLQGNYLTIGDDGQLSKDTVVVTAQGYRFGYFDPADRVKQNDEYERGVLSDSMIMKSYHGYYFLNLNEKPEWLLRVLQQEKNGDLWYMSLEEKEGDFNEYLTRLSVEVKIDSTKTGSETLYQIDPTPNELIKLIEKGLFTKVKLKKIR
jgi:hypothetical protein